MSSRVLIGDAAIPAEPMAWRRLPPGAGHHSGYGSGPASMQENDAAGLQRRIVELEREIQTREQAGYRRGLEETRAAAEKEAGGRLNPVAQRLAATVAELAEYRRRIRRDAEADLVKLSVMIARRLLHRELTIDPEAVLGIVKAALEKLDAREIDRLRVNPDDATLIRSHLGRLSTSRAIEIAADPQLERGAVIFETTRGSLDASVETQLDEIQRGLIDRVRS